MSQVDQFMARLKVKWVKGAYLPPGAWLVKNDDNSPAQPAAQAALVTRLTSACCCVFVQGFKPLIDAGEVPQKNVDACRTYLDLPHFNKVPCACSAPPQPFGCLGRPISEA